jgi:hypothetical protein
VWINAAAEGGAENLRANVWAVAEKVAGVANSSLTASSAFATTRRITHNPPNLRHSERYTQIRSHYLRDHLPTFSKSAPS